MKRSGAGSVNIVAGLIVGLVAGLALMYVLAPSLIGSTGSTSTNTGGSVSTTTSFQTVTSTVEGSGAATVTETTTVTGGGSTAGTTTTTVTTTVGSGATLTTTSTVTSIQTTTVSGATGFYGGVVFVNIAPGTGSNLSLNFSPATIKVVLGVNSTVVWTNHDNTQHTVTADILALFNSGTLNPGQSFGYTFTQAGNYRYTCQFHGYMIGNVIVKPLPA